MSQKRKEPTRPALSIVVVSWNVHQLLKQMKEDKLTP